MLRVDSLNQHFGGLHALNDVTFEVKEGEILGIIGPNGAGKSTLFNSLIGITPPSSGHVWFEGNDLTKMSVRKVISSGVAKTSQTVQIFEEMTVLDNVAIAALRLRRKLEDARRYAYEELEFWGLASYADTQARYITLAQRATLELTRALTLAPKILLVDEVMAGLNEVEVNQMLDRFMLANKERGVSLVVIEHNMRALMRIAHRILCLNYGSILAIGNPERISTDQRVIDAYLGVE